jgi:hypothetical protein
MNIRIPEPKQALWSLFGSSQEPPSDLPGMVELLSPMTIISMPNVSMASIGLILHHMNVVEIEIRVQTRSTLRDTLARFSGGDELSMRIPFIDDWKV